MHQKNKMKLQYQSYSIITCGSTVVGHSKERVGTSTGSLFNALILIRNFEKKKFTGCTLKSWLYY